MHRLTRLGLGLYNFIASDRGFYSVLALLAVSTLWVASFSLYPMAFDEEFHYGLIKIYASSLLPYGIEHTSDMAQYGSATADASYLFHYLMSFPYRLLDFMSASDTTIILLLRYMNIAFVIGAFILFRKALLLTKASSAAVTISLAFVSLIPVLIMLAAQINYDNLLLLVIAWCLLLTFRITTSLNERRTISLRDGWQLVAAVLIGVSIKYAFLPIALVIGLWLAALVAKRYLLLRGAPVPLTKDLARQWHSLSGRSRSLHVLLLLVSLCFASHYLINMISYGSPMPSCDQVFSEVECQAYGPWSRNKLYASEKQISFQPLSYPSYMSQEWFPGMTERLTFALAGKTNGFQTKSPLPIVMVGFIIVAVIGAGCLVIQIIRGRLSWFGAFTLLLTVVYAGALSYQLYGDYVETARPVAINGRYLIPLLPLVTLALIGAMREALRRVSPPTLALVSSGIFVVFLIGGGGVGTYIVQSESHWYSGGFAQSNYKLAHSIFDTVIPLRFKD